MLILTLLAATPVAKSLLYSFGPYRANVPRPESILGYKAGRFQSNFRQMEIVDLAIARAAPSRVRYETYGTSVEGRPLRIFFVSDPKNIGRLQEIRKQHALLADGRGNPADTIPIVWINECMHGDETASFEAGMWTLYNLAASRSRTITEELKHVVVAINPVFNPDGHERFVVYYDSLPNGSADRDAYENMEPSVIYGRLNHYRFDMNRDHVAFSQKEVIEEFAEVQRWHPQVYADEHGQVPNYFFPPEPMSINENVGRSRNFKWKNLFSRSIAKSFDRYGFTYFTKTDFDFYYPGYLDVSNSLSGAIGMTFETNGGRLLNALQSDGSIVTLKEGLEKHFISSLSVVRTAAKHRTELMADYFNFKKGWIDGSLEGKFRSVIVRGDPRALERFRLHLARAGIKSAFADQSFSQPVCHDYWTGNMGSLSVQKGDLCVNISQSQGAFAKALLDPRSHFEAAFVKRQLARRASAPKGERYPGPKQGEFYDLTAWALPYDADLAAWWSEQPIASDRTKLSYEITLKLPEQDSPVGYVIPYSDEDDALAAAAALQSGLRINSLGHELYVDEKQFPGGSFVFFSHRNPPDLRKRLVKIARNRHADVIALNSAYPDEGSYGPGSPSAYLLKAPKIALLAGTVGRIYAMGAPWFLLEKRWRLRYTAVSTNVLDTADLERFNCLIVPRGANIDDPDMLKSWVARGNVLIVLEASNGAVGPSGFANLNPIAGNIGSLPGDLFKASIDPRSFLSFGYPVGPSGGVDLAWPMQGRRFFQSLKTGGTFVTVDPDQAGSDFLSGWAWPGDTKRHLAGAACVQDVPVGAGNVIVFLSDPTDRAMYPGLDKLLLNSILFGNAGQ